MEGSPRHSAVASLSSTLQELVEDLDPQDIWERIYSS